MPPSPITSTSVYRPAMTVPIPSSVGTPGRAGRAQPLAGSTGSRGGIGIGVVERLRRLVGPVLAGRDAVAGSAARREPGRRDRRPVERAAALGVAGQQLLQPSAQVRIPGACMVEERGSFGRIGAAQGFGEEVEFVHGTLLWGGSSHPMRNSSRKRAVDSRNFFPNPATGRPPARPARRPTRRRRSAGRCPDRRPLRGGFDRRSIAGSRASPPSGRPRPVGQGPRGPRGRRHRGRVPERRSRSNVT